MFIYQDKKSRFRWKNIVN